MVGVTTLHWASQYPLQLAWQEAVHWAESALAVHLVEQSALHLAPQSTEQLKLPGVPVHWGVQVSTQTWTSVGWTETVHWGAHTS
jgi:hypothetical protein